MNTTAITEEDIRALRKSTSKATRLATFIVLPLFVAFLIAAGSVNLHFCSRFSDMAGMNMADVIGGWFAGIDTSAQYSGAYLKALERWVAGISELSVAGFVALMWVGARRMAKRNARILKVIEEKETP